ncbi:MAG TPA: 2-phosphosulfolactate phosphatase [Acidimicrobiales bacterium]|nr:2-phosphosulfolactate phosphatase [Acidimicrobiales bacterium]
MVIVDVLRFTTAVTVAVEQGAIVLPYRWRDDGAAAHAWAHGAVLAGMRESGGWSLSPADLQRIPAGTKLVLPSPNGSALSFTARELGAGTVMAGCLRNASAVGRTVRSIAGSDGVVVVIAAGEQWANPGVRRAEEDLLGAGAVLAAAGGAPSPDAAAACDRFASWDGDLLSTESGQELLGWGYDDDVAMAAELDVCTTVPVLRGHSFTAVE